MKVVKEQLAKLNASLWLKHSNAQPILIEEILSPDALFWLGNSSEKKGSVSSETKHLIINNYFLKRRSEEDIYLIKDEMNNLLDYYKSQKAIVMEELTVLQSADIYNSLTKPSLDVSLDLF